MIIEIQAPKGYILFCEHSKVYVLFYKWVTEELGFRAMTVDDWIVIFLLHANEEAYMALFNR